MTQTNTDLRTVKSDASQGTGSYCSNLYSVNGDVYSVDGDVDSLSGDLDTITYDIGTARSDIAALRKDLANLSASGLPGTPGGTAHLSRSAIDPPGERTGEQRH